MKRDIARKRQLDELKQLRKEKIIRDSYGINFLDSKWLSQPHRLSKGKIHCSCPMCATKTNAKHGTIEHGWKASDIKKMKDISYN